MKLWTLWMGTRLLQQVGLLSNHCSPETQISYHIVSFSPRCWRILRPSWLYIASILFLVFFQHGHRLLGMLSKKQRYLLFYRLQSSICTFNYKYESYLLFFFLFPIATNLSPVDHLLLDLFMVVFLVDLNPIYHFPYGLLR